MPNRPLIVTLDLDPASFRLFDDLRRAHYPTALNHVPAHISLFHHLPDDDEDGVRKALAGEAQRNAPLLLRVVDVRFLGRGVAYRIESEELSSLRQSLALTFDRWLTPQDRQRFAPHVTIQNKVATDEARRLWHELEAQLTPFDIRGTGLNLWRYLGGPWELLERLDFVER